MKTLQRTGEKNCLYDIHELEHALYLVEYVRQRWKALKKHYAREARKQTPTDSAYQNYSTMGTSTAHDNSKRLCEAQKVSFITIIITVVILL